MGKFQSFFPILLILLLLSQPLSATTQLRFNFVYNISSQLSLTSVQEIGCSDENCLSRDYTITWKQCNGDECLLPPAPVTPLDLTVEFSCSENTCTRIGDASTYYHRLIANFSDGTSKESKTFVNEYYGLSDVGIRNYTVVVNKDGLAVMDSDMPLGPSSFSISYALENLFLILVVEGLAALVYSILFNVPNRLVLSVIFANLVSFPVVLALPVLLQMNQATEQAIFEIAAIAIEATIIYLFNKEYMPLKNSFILSIAMHFLSFAIGSWLYFFTIT